MGKPDYLTCLLQNLYAGKEATVWTGHETRLVQNWESFKGTKYIKAVYFYTVYLTSIQNTSYTRPDEAQAGIKIARRNINNLR